MGKVLESVYNSLNEMAMDEMALQKPARLIKKHLEYSNKYSLNDVKKLLDLSFEKIFEEGASSKKYDRTIKSISSILLSDFETDFYEFAEDIVFDVDENEAKEIVNEILNHYYEYANIFKEFYNKCTEKFQDLIKNPHINPDDEDYKSIIRAAKYAYNQLIKGMKKYVKDQYPKLIDEYDLFK